VTDNAVFIVHCIDTEGPLYESVDATFERLRDIFQLELEPSSRLLRQLQAGEVPLGGLEAAVQKVVDPSLLAYNDTWDKVDAMLAGGSEMATCVTGMSGFAQARALSQRNSDPQAASRPWDKDRDGFVMGDGAGAMMLEEYEHAKARGAKIYAEVVGFGMSGDAHHVTAPPEDGEGARKAMAAALTDAQLNPAQVQYVNAHATSTELGDRAETLAIRRAFGAAADQLAVSSTKSMTGHLLGAAGAVEAIFSVLALCDQVAPPTINLHQPGEGCDLDYVPNTARPMSLNYTLSNSFGFGGTNGSLIFRRL